MEKFNYKGFKDCVFFASRYRDNGNLALQIVNEEDGPIVTPTVNPGEALDDDCIAVKNYSENTGMLDFLREHDIVGEVVRVIPSGWVEIPVCRLTEKGKALFKNV